MATAAELEGKADSLDAFRAEARDWLAANFPPSLKGKDNAMSAVEGPTERQRRRGSVDARRWARRAGACRPGPAQYGGGGLSRGRGARAAARKWRAIGAWNPIGGMGVMMFGPTLLEYGSEAQKQRAYPGDRQGRGALVPGLFASPAPAPTSPACRPSPRTRATIISSTARRPGPRAGNGPTGASRWCAPTSRKKHEGISFLLIDMDSPGVEVQPIRLISGAVAVLRDLLHRREGAQGKSGRRAKGRAGRSASACCSTSGTNLSGGGCERGAAVRAASRCASSPRNISAPTTTGRIADSDLRDADRPARDGRCAPSC